MILKAWEDAHHKRLSSQKDLKIVYRIWFYFYIQKGETQLFNCGGKVVINLKVNFLRKSLQIREGYKYI